MFGLKFITHNLSLVKKFSDRLYVMKNGSIVEEGLTKRVFENPKHPQRVAIE